jgi:hypothetical protein
MLPLCRQGLRPRTPDLDSEMAGEDLDKWGGHPTQSLICAWASPAGCLTNCLTMTAPKGAPDGTLMYAR